MIRGKILFLSAILASYMAGSWGRIRYELRTVPSLWKILLVGSFSVFATFTLIWAFGLEWLLFELLDAFGIHVTGEVHIRFTEF